MSVLVWENGIGKSAVLQALDYFLNQEPIWNGATFPINRTWGKGGQHANIGLLIELTDDELVETFSEQSVVDTIKSERYQSEIRDLISKDKVSNIENLYHPGRHLLAVFLYKSWYTTIRSLKKKEREEYAWGSGVEDSDGEDDVADTSDFRKDELIKWSEYGKVAYEWLKGRYRFLYIEAEIEIDKILSLTWPIIEQFTNISNTLEWLQDNNKTKLLNTLYESLEGFTENINVILEKEKLSFDKQSRLRTAWWIQAFTKKLVESYFATHILSRKKANEKFAISELSSWERRRAFIDFVAMLISNKFKDSKDSTEEREILLVGIDEPEISVDTAWRIEQFQKLEELSEKVWIRVLLTSHWFWWLHTNRRSTAYLLEKIDHNHISTRISTQMMSGINSDEREEIPNHYEVKSLSDLVASLLSGQKSEKRYLFCEWATDELILNAILSHAGYRHIICKSIGNQHKAILLAQMIHYANRNKEPWEEIKNIACLIDTDMNPWSAEDYVDLNSMKRLIRWSRHKNTWAVTVVQRKKSSEELCCSLERALDPELLERVFSDMASKYGNAPLGEILKKKIKYDTDLWISAFWFDEREINSLNQKEIKREISERYPLLMNETYVLPKAISLWASQINNFFI